MLSILEMLVKFSLQFNFLDRRLKKQNHKLKFHSCCFFKFSNFCKISRAPAISLHSDNKFPPAVLVSGSSWRKLLGNSNLKEIWRKFRKIEGNVKEIALFLQNPKNTAISKEMRFKICWKSCLRDAKSENFLGEDHQTPHAYSLSC
jgi:hypothetical protein